MDPLPQFLFVKRAQASKEDGVYTSMEGLIPGSGLHYPFAHHSIVLSDAHPELGMPVQMRPLERVVPERKRELLSGLAAAYGADATQPNLATPTANWADAGTDPAQHTHNMKTAIRKVLERYVAATVRDKAGTGAVVGAPVGALAGFMLARHKRTGKKARPVMGTLLGGLAGAAIGGAAGGIYGGTNHATGAAEFRARNAM
jgi:hypothetical protein